MVYRLAYRMLRNKNEAEDVVQEVFIQVWQQRTNFRELSHYSTWIYRITTNKCIDYLRARKRRAIMEWLKFSVAVDIFTPNEPSDTTTNPLESIHRKEQRLALNAAIASLPVMQQTAFVLLKMEGLTQKEAATILNITEKALESLLQRANKSLRKKLEKFYSERRII